MKQNPHIRLFSHYPLAQLAVAYSTGILLANFCNFKTSWFLTTAGLFSVLTFALRNHQKISGPFLLLAFLFIASGLFSIEHTRTPANSLRLLLTEDEQSVLLTGEIVGPVEYSRDRVDLVMNVHEVSTSHYKRQTTGLVSLVALFKTPADNEQYRKLDLHHGSRLQVLASINRADKYRNPGVSTISEYLDRKNYDATGIVKSLVPSGEANVFRPLVWLYSWRSSLQDQIDQNFSPDTAGVLDAALLGDRYNLTKSTTERYREAGTFHMLVISGLHISLIGGLIFLLARRLTRRRWGQFVVSNLVVWAYTLAVGAEASVVRASLMFTLITFAGVVFRSASALNSLGAAALVLLVKSPKDLFDPSLQLTFLSVLAIVVIAWPLLQNFRAIGGWHPTRETPFPPQCHPFIKTICEWFYWDERRWQSELQRMPHRYRLFKSPVAVWLERNHLQRPLRYSFNSIVVSLSVQLVLLPFLIIYFHRLSISSLVLNIVVGLLLAALCGVALAAVLLSQLSTTLATPLFKFANLLDWLTTHSVDPFSRLGIASIRLGEYSGHGLMVYAIYYLPLLVLVFTALRWSPLVAPCLRKRRRNPLVWLAVLMQLSMLTIVLVHPFSTGRPDGKLHVDFLDVGQGDAALITMPDGATLLVDGGGRPTFRLSSNQVFERESRSIGEMVVSEYLWWRGLDAVDYVLATHADADHIDGLNDVVRNFHVRAALVGRSPQEDAEYVKFAGSINATHTAVELIGSGDELHFGEVVMRILWPLPSADPKAPSQNNDSVVLLIKFGERAILLTGDIEKETETQLLASYPNLHVDLVKVAHHGSHSSSIEKFVHATSPQYAVISVGRTSMFGHPHPEVVERWKQTGADVLTTGQSGTISVTTDGKEMWVKKYVDEVSTVTR
ncbi:MAG TPA: ComEC/Rec2 family competence protein [Pyrinomonadaceae bacterium]